jgi:hypothetical protein
MVGPPENMVGYPENMVSSPENVKGSIFLMYDWYTSLFLLCIYNEGNIDSSVYILSRQHGFFCVDWR